MQVVCKHKGQDEDVGVDVETGRAGSSLLVAMPEG